MISALLCASSCGDEEIIEASETPVVLVQGRAVPVYLDIGQPRASFLSTVGMGGDSNILVFGAGDSRSIDPVGLRASASVAFFSAEGEVQYVGEIHPDGPALVVPPEMRCRFALVSSLGAVPLRVGQHIEIPTVTRRRLRISQRLKLN